MAKNASGKSRGTRYEPNAATSAMPLRLDEVEALQLAGVGSLARDENAIAHLLGRVAATIKEQRRLLSELQTELEHALRVRAEDDHPMQRALRALNELDDDGRARVLDIHYLAALDEAERHGREAEAAKIVAVSEANRVRFALSRLLADPMLSPELRGRIEYTMAQLPRNE